MRAAFSFARPATTPIWLPKISHSRRMVAEAKGNSMAGFRDRVSQRFQTDLAVLACTVIESRPARLVDISMHGARLESDNPYPAGQRIALDLDGERLFGVVTWAEIDRMGVKFETPLDGGPFRDALDTAMRRQSFEQAVPGGAAVRRPTFGRRIA